MKTRRWPQVALVALWVSMAAVAGWFIVRYAQGCREISACESAGRIETSDCRPDRVPGRVTCEWRCVDLNTSKEKP